MYGASRSEHFYCVFALFNTVPHNKAAGNHLQKSCRHQEGEIWWEVLIF